MKNWKFNALILFCALAWLGMLVGSMLHRSELVAMPYIGRFFVALIVSAPILAAFSLLTYQLNALKQDEYQQELLRGQILWASIMAILMTATTGFIDAFDPDPKGQTFAMTVTVWFAGFLIRGLSSSARL